MTVCITTRNQRGYLVQCVDSVLAQRGDFDLEVLVGDDASDDGSSELAAMLASRHPGVVQHVRHPERIGPSANTKALVARAQGSFIAKLDGDDYWLEGKLARQLAAIEASTGCSAVYTNALTVDPDDRPLGVFNDAGDMRLDLAAFLRGGNFLNNSSMLCRAAHRDAWLAMPDPLLDYQVHLMHARHGDLLHLGEPLVAYRVATAGSMVAESGSHVRDLYWQAIESVPRELVSNDDYAHGITDFLRRVFFRALRMRDPALLRAWASRIYAASPYGVLRTTVLAAANIMRMSGKMVLGKLREPGRRRVLYRR